MEQIIVQAEAWVKDFFAGDTTGHDWHHTDRVRKTAVVLAEKEGADRQICELAALLHDAGDDKFHSSEEDGRLFVQEWLQKQTNDEILMSQILTIIGTVSFKGGNNRPPETLEGKIVQDADRMDAIGAVGIARCFMYAGHKGDAMHVPEIKPRHTMSEQEYRSGTSTAVNHFHEKLLKLSSQMKTASGKEMARERHDFLEQFLDRFHQEWDGWK